jgi:uncharacterized protein DUF4157
MEPRFGHDFSRVRVHTGQSAIESVNAVGAVAFAVGRHVVFGNGRYAPGSAAGRALLAHELAHVVQQEDQATGPTPIALGPDGGRAEAEADEASRMASQVADTGRRLSMRTTPPQLARQTNPVPAATAPMTRAEFEAAVRQRFGVQSVRTGTLVEQEQQSTRRGAPIAPKIDPTTWRPWDPGGSAETYGWIVASLESMSANFGGIPQVKEIVFFEVAYEQNTSTGAVEAHPETGASYGAGVMIVYHSGIARPSPFPMGRSSAKPPAKRPVAVVQSPGSSPGADLPLPTQAESAERAVTHELAHGVAEAALTPPTSGGSALDDQMMADYKAAVGWRGSPGSEQLFDIGAKAVQSAIAKGTALPGDFEITEAHWNDPKWVEQPMSWYMVHGGPSEDFAEAVSAFLNAPAALRARSPSRYKFLQSRKARWEPGLRKPATPQPAPRGGQPNPSVRPPAPARPRFGPLYQPRRNFTPEILKSAEDL